MRPGFTLLELLVVLAVIGLASAVTVPRLLDGSSDPLARASAEIMGVLNDARLRAARSGSTHRLTLDPATRRYWIEGAQGQVHTDTLNLSAGVSIGTNRARLYFRFAPTAESSADTLVLLSQHGVRVITLDAWTGAVRAY
ncbi:MAG: prepilin-type N-terminal cleavage/methylation domain-containing protein [Pseudomonas sp.]